MRHFVVLLALALVLLGCGASATQLQARVADGMGRAVDAEVPSLVAAYEAEGDAAIDSAASLPEAEVLLEDVRARWRAVWHALEAFRAAHDGWATALETGGSVDVGRLQSAYCELRAAVEGRAELPDVGCPP